MQFGICTGPENALITAEAGYDFIEVHVQNHLVPRASEEDFAPLRDTLLAAALPSIAANCFLPGDLRSTGDEVDLDGVLDYARIAFRRAEIVGIRTIVFGSGGSRKLDPGIDPEDAFEQFVDLNALLAPIAMDYGVTLVIEPLNRGECNFINTIDEGAAIVEAVDHPSVRLLVDLFHMLRNDEDADAIRRWGDLIYHAHLAERDERTCPGIAGDDLRGYFDALHEVGYDGPVSIEGKFPNGISTDGPRALSIMQGWAGLGE